LFTVISQIPSSYPGLFQQGLFLLLRTIRNNLANLNFKVSSVGSAQVLMDPIAMTADWQPRNAMMTNDTPAEQSQTTEDQTVLSMTFSHSNCYNRLLPQWNPTV